jgi:hypothetical protein
MGVVSVVQIGQFMQIGRQFDVTNGQVLPLTSFPSNINIYYMDRIFHGSRI